MRHQRPFALATAAAASVSGLLASAAPAGADINYSPPSGTWNGRNIFLSRACHDRSDGVPGGPCIPNSGCNGYNENTNSNSMTTWIATGEGDRDNLIERGYKVRIGTGTVDENVASSNTWGATLHIPVHSNAKVDDCASNDVAGHGTWMMYTSPDDEACGNTFLGEIGAYSPGTNDRTVVLSGYPELNTNATTCYMESEFHTWSKGTSWLTDYVHWALRAASAVDIHLGYPRP